MVRTACDSAISPDPMMEEFHRRIVYEDADLLNHRQAGDWPVHGNRHHAVTQHY